MKKTLLTIVFIIALALSASAQFKPFQFGLKVEPGIGWSKLNSDHLFDGKTKMNFNWGFVGNIYFVENYGLSTGFNVKFMNNEYSFNTNMYGDVTRTIKNQYLEIPIGLTMRTEEMGEMRILGNVSYGLGFLLNTNEKNFDSNGNEVTMISDYNKIRHALIVKLGVEYYVHKSSCIVAALVFNNNFANIYGTDYEQNVLLNNLNLEIGFMF
ncbi:MAG: outer membrane beta-barrel protein [Bacteroidales bacterium]|nr:outer membrane beta-barrel protein [Bacteroidales bacterium]